MVKGFALADMKHTTCTQAQDQLMILPPMPMTSYHIRVVQVGDKIYCCLKT